MEDFQNFDSHIQKFNKDPNSFNRIEDKFIYLAKKALKLDY